MTENSQPIPEGAFNLMLLSAFIHVYAVYPELNEPCPERGTVLSDVTVKRWLATEVGQKWQSDWAARWLGDAPVETLCDRMIAALPPR